MGSREQLDARIRTFATEIEDLIRRATEEGIKTAIASALASGQLVKPSASKATPPASPAATTKAAKKAPVAVAAKSAKAAKVAKAAKPAKAPKATKIDKRRKGQKRSPEELAALEAKLEAFIHANGGKRIEEIGKELAIATSELAGPVKKMLDAGRIRSTGERRATRYYPAKKK